MPGRDSQAGAPTGRALDPRDWTPRELRHSFVSLLSDAGMPIEQISRLVGHSGTATTETIYRKQIRPALLHGADAMDLLFPARMRVLSYSFRYSAPRRHCRVMAETHHYLVGVAGF